MTFGFCSTFYLFCTMLGYTAIRQRLKFQRIAVLNKLRFTWGCAEVLPMSNVQIKYWPGWHDLSSSLCPNYICMHRGARPKVSLRWPVLKVIKYTEPEWLKILTLTAKNQYGKFATNIPRQGIARPQSQFRHSCVRERFIYSHHRSAYSATGNMWSDPGNI